MPEVVATPVTEPIITSTAPDDENQTPPPAETVEGESPPVAVKTEAEKAAEAKDAEAEKGKGQARLERKLSKAIREAAEQKARADYLERQHQEQARTTAPASPDEPKLENYASIEEWAEAKAAHAVKKDREALTEAWNRQRNSNAQQTILTQWEEKVSKADGKYPDFDQIVGEMRPVNALTAAVMQAENGEDVAYYLATHRQEAARIVSLDPISQVREIGRLEAKLMAEPPKPNTVTNAPPPLKPVGASNATSNKKLVDMSFDEFAKRRREQIAARH